jgi:hypothetical protein
VVTFVTIIVIIIIIIIIIIISCCYGLILLVSSAEQFSWIFTTRGWNKSWKNSRYKSTKMDSKR